MKAIKAGGGLAAWALAMALAGCGGGGGGGGTTATSPPADGCDVASMNGWLSGFMSDWYYWSGAQPAPDPAGYPTLASYFDAWRYAGDVQVPRDHWSYLQDTATYNQFFGAGQVLGYGMFLALVNDTPPLQVSYVEPGSPAAVAGVRRGDYLVTLNGRRAEDVVAARDYAMLSPHAGDVLALQLRTGGTVHGASLQAATYSLEPAPVAKVVSLPDGSKAGYLLVTDFITQAEAPMARAFEDFRAAGATELIIDLRVNGGGRLSTSGLLASLVTGATNAGGVYATLHYNAKHPSADRSFLLDSRPGPAFSRVVVLTGPRTCSASELVVNGLKPYANVVTIGGTTCGKPFGFNPVASCGTTVSAVNFETVNARGEGRYYAGIEPTCGVNDDFMAELGDPAEKLTAAATSFLGSGVCPPVGAGPRSSGLVAPAGRQRMIAD